MSKQKPSNGGHESKSPNRRQFIQSTAAAGSMLAAPIFLPSTVLGRNGAVPPNEKIILGGIGIGNRGGYDLRRMLRFDDVHFVATCDPQKERRQKVKEFVDNRYSNNDCELYSDIREFLAVRTDIDAVLVTTGDRWHALGSILAMRAGKDVYSEKPSCMTIAEGQAVVDTANRYGRVYQTGTQRLSEANFTFANELLRTGRLGEVHTVRAHIAPWNAAKMSHDWRPEQELPPSNEVDWDQWLGLCPWRPYNEKYVQGGWRGYYDFHTSCIGEWGAHTFAQCQFAIGATDTSAIEYQYVPNETGDGMVTKFSNGINMILQKEGWKGSCGVRYEGDEGWVATADNYDKPDVSNPAWLDDYDKLVNDYMARTQRPMDHWRNFLDSVKSRRPAVADPEVMYRSMTTVHAANICMWLERDMKYDPVNAVFLNDDEANRLRSRAMRAPWII